jgi:class 3 adenylate cyclase/alpha-beta hydrolase superfamily lysophospholipase
MDPRIQYTTTRDGANIAFWVAGEGPVLVQVPAIPWSHSQAEWEDPDWRTWYDRLLQNHRVVRYDARGGGLSDRDRVECSLETMLLDFEAVVERLGLEQFDIIGGPTGGPAAIAYAAAHPDRVNHLILWCAFAQPADWHAPQLAALAALARTDWTLYTETLAHAMVAGWDEASRATRFAAICRQAATVDSYDAMVAAFATLDLRDLLASIEAPTLVLHRKRILVPAVEVAQSLAARIPDARLLLLEGGSTLPFIGDMESLARAIDQFTLGEVIATRDPAPARPAPEPGSLRAILCSDIAGHTPMMNALGDASGRVILREHERLTRDAINRFEGREVKTFGDGFLASFASAQQAIECAIAMQRDFVSSPILGRDDLGLRIGINAGEPIAENGDLYGAAVITATQLASFAQAGEIIVSNVVRELSAGKGFLFARRAEAIAMRSFEDPIRLYELRWAPE